MNSDLNQVFYIMIDQNKQTLKTLMAMAPYGANFQAMLAIELPDGSVVLMKPNHNLLCASIEDEYMKMRAAEAMEKLAFANLIGKTVTVQITKAPQFEVGMCCPNCGCTRIKRVESLKEGDVGKCDNCKALLDLDLLNAKQNNI